MMSFENGHLWKLPWKEIPFSNPESKSLLSDRDDVDPGGVCVRVQGERGVPQGDRHDHHPLHDHAALRGLLPRRHGVQHQPGQKRHMSAYWVLGSFMGEQTDTNISLLCRVCTGWPIRSVTNEVMKTWIWRVDRLMGGSTAQRGWWKELNQCINSYHL